MFRQYRNGKSIVRKLTMRVLVINEKKKHSMTIMAFSLHKEGGQFVFTLTTMTSKNLNTILNCLNTVKVKCPMLICLTLLLTVVAGAAREDHNNVYTSPRRLALLTFLVPP